MNPVVETMLKDLIAETEQYGPGAVYAVLSLLYSCYRNGTHNDFARHCCEFSAVQIGTITTSTSQNTGGSSTNDPDRKEWVC